MTYVINHNEHFGSLEISFETKPSAEIIAALKAKKFRWHGIRRLWYGFADAAEI